MIISTSNTTTIENSRDGKNATISVIGGFNYDHTLARLRLQQFMPGSDVAVGSDKHDINETVKDIPKVDIMFYSVESIDVYIDILQKLREKLFNPPGPQYYLAC